MADIELVIKIPEEKYNYVKKQVAKGIDNPLKVYIANSTVLPEHHGRLIDADKAIQRLCGKSCGCTLEECGYEVPCFSMQRINLAPTIIEADKAESEDKE